MKSINKQSVIENKMYWIDKRIEQETYNEFNDTISIYDGVYGDTLVFTKTESNYWDCSDAIFEA